MFNGTIAVVGAIAAAVTTVVALRPVDREDFVDFTSISVTSGVSYSEYRQRSVAPHPTPQGLGRAAMVIAAPASAPAAETTEVDPEETTIPAEPTAPRSPESTRKADVPDSTTIPTPVPTAVGRMLHQPDQRTGNTLRLAPVDPPPPQWEPWINGACRKHKFTSCQSLGGEISQLPFTDVDGNVLPTKEAEAELVAVIKSLRTTKTKKGRKQAVGAVIDLNIELSGLRGKTVRLSWSLWRQGGTKQIYRAWLNENLAYELTATSDHDSAGLNFWIPLPKGKGPYFVRSKLTMDGHTLASENSRTFK